MDQERAIMAELPSDQAAKAKVISQSGSVSVYQDLTSGKLTYGAFIKADLAQQGINPADYSGWNIGVGSVAPNTGSAFIGYGDYSVILVPAS